MKPLPPVQIARAIFHIDESIAHQGRESGRKCVGSLPDGSDHRLLVLLVPLDCDSKQAGRESGLEETKEETNSPYSVNVLRESEGEDTLRDDLVQSSRKCSDSLLTPVQKIMATPSTFAIGKRLFS